MHLQTQTRPKVISVQVLEDRIDAATAIQFKEKMRDATRDGPARVVLDPVPRIVNRSFAQFVRHVEEPKRLAIWQANQPDGLWTRLRAPLTFVLPLTLALVVLVLAEGSGSLATTIPFLLAAGPALLNVVGGLRRSFG